MPVPRLAGALAAVLLSGAGTPLCGEPGPATANHITALVGQLGNPVYAVREAALRDLVALGEAALPALQTASASEDLEVHRRTRVAIRRIIFGARMSKSIGLELVVVEPNEFQMGSPANEANRRPDETIHRVRLTGTFLLGAYEVTQDEYQKVMKAAPSWFAAAGGGKAKVAGENTDRFPVENVTWFDAIAFCNQLSQRDGYEPYYKMTDVKRTSDRITTATVTVVNGNGYRLPTEAEWEFACRAGTTTPFHYGYANSGREANLKPGPATGYGSPVWNSLGRTAKVGSYKPNGYGLFDMHGNVGEWCGDWYDKDYSTEAVTINPRGPHEGRQRLVRGGSWMVNEGSCRSASRFWLTPDEAKDYVGFRIARTP